MVSHRREMPTLRSLSKRQWAKIAVTASSLALFAGVGVASRNYYDTAHHAPAATVTAYSATDANALQVSRSQDRSALAQGQRGAQANPRNAYITVKINGKSRVVFGTDFTTVKSVLDTADITLEPHDAVSPALSAPVDESTVITIERAGARLETSDAPITFNTVTKETPDLPRGTQRVQTEGKNGVMETNSIVERAGKHVIASNVFTSFVKQAPVDKVVLVGTGSAAPAVGSSAGASGSAAGRSAAASSIGTTTPVGQMQQWAHDTLLASGGSEADFTATVFIISHESGWRVNATNPSSGAYGLPQALPGGKMASAGADWATNYQTQLRWFWNYCKARYGSVQGAYAYWQSHHSY